jgi:hypothetical protein
MKISKAFPSRWLKSDDIGMDRKVRCSIRSIKVETVADEDKLIMYFNGKTKGMVLNKTNAGRLAVPYGDDTDDWIEKDVILYVEQVSFQGRMVPAIRVEVPRRESSKFTDEAPPVQEVVHDREADDEIPF